MNARFEYFADAIEAGYTRASACVLERYKGIDIVSHDASEPDSRGEKFVVVAQLSIEEANRSGVFYEPLVYIPITTSEIVWFTKEENQIHNEGSFQVMYAPAAKESAIAVIKEVIDSFRQMYPELPSAKEQVIIDKKSDDVAPLLARMRVALKQGHPSVRLSNGSGEVVFAVSFPRFRKDGSWWPSESAHLAYHDPALALEQMEYAGLLDE